MAYKNIADKRAYDKKWIKAHPKNRRVYEKKWRAKNPEKVLAQRKRYYKKNKELVRKCANDYYHNIRKQYLKENADSERIKNRERNQIKYAKRKALLLQLRYEAGGKCINCGYDDEIRILQFHHPNKDKIDNVTNLQTFKKIRDEATKCVLLCPNCHALIHLK